MLDGPTPGDLGFARKSDLAYIRVRELILSGDLEPPLTFAIGEADITDAPSTARVGAEVRVRL